jgi:hypothetical protein
MRSLAYRRSQPPRRVLGLGAKRMLVIEHNRLKFLRAGHPITVPDDGKHRIGRTYALRIGTQRRATHHIKITNIDSGQLTIMLADQDPPRLLAARSQYGYTDRLSRSLPDELPCDAVPAEYQRHLTELGTFRWQQEIARREAARTLQQLYERLRDLEHRQARGESNLDEGLRMIRHRLQTIRERDAA